MSLLIAIMGLGFLVFVHEGGHFLTARAVGMSPRRFYVGFPPALIRIRRKGIEYGIGAIPLGGYVKIPGMHRPAPSDLDVRGPYFGAAVSEAPQIRPWLERVKERLADGDIEGARELLPELESALADVRLSPLARKAADRGLNELRDGLGPDAYWRQSTWKRVAVIFAGPGTNLVLAIVLFFALFSIAGGNATREVEAVSENSPAAEAGLRPRDRILEVNGVPVQPNEISKRIRSSQSSGAKSVRLVVLRDGHRATLRPVRPKLDQGAYRLGFRLDAERLGPASALWHSVRLTGLVTREIGKSLFRLVHGEGRRDISSPVGIVQGSSNALNEGVETYVWVLGLISLSLALLNLLPLLPLDGGHIAFSLVEGIRGRAVGREVYERVSAVGIALVLLLFFIGLSNDVSRLGD